MNIPDLDRLAKRYENGLTTPQGAMIELGELVGQLAQENDLLRDLGARFKGVTREEFDEAFDGVLAEAQAKARRRKH